MADQPELCVYSRNATLLERITIRYRALCAGVLYNRRVRGRGCARINPLGFDASDSMINSTPR